MKSSILIGQATINKEIGTIGENIKIIKLYWPRLTYIYI